MTSTTNSRVTEYEGIPVVSDEQAQSPLSTPEKIIYFNTVRVLTLSDDSIVYCDNDYTMFDRRIGILRSKMFKAKGGKMGRKGAAKPEVGDMTDQMIKILAIIKENKKLVKQNDNWKQRATHAEGQLKKLKTALSSI